MMRQLRPSGDLVIDAAADPIRKPPAGKVAPGEVPKAPQDMRKRRNSVRPRNLGSENVGINLGIHPVNLSIFPADVRHHSQLSPTSPPPCIGPQGRTRSG